MKKDNSETQTTADLAALAAVANGSTAQPKPLTARDLARLQKVDELRLKYQAGTLPIDEKGLAAKLIDSMLEGF